MIEFVELKKFPPKNPGDSKYALVPVWINKIHVLRLSSAHKYNTLLKEGKLPSGLDPALEFTEVYLNVVTPEHEPLQTSRHIIVGDPSTVAGTLNPGDKKKKTILKG